MNRPEAEQIATAISMLRPDWLRTSLLTLLAKHQHRSARDVMLALVWVAYDPETKTPGRIDAEGPWWGASRTAGMPDAPRPTPRCDRHGDWMPCLTCQREQAGPAADPAVVAAILDAAGVKRSGGRSPALTEPTAITGPTERMPRLTEDQINAERARQLAALESIRQAEEAS